MYNEFGGTLSNLALAKHRAINAENRTGEKGKGGMAASDLGPSRKGSPCLRDIASGQTVTLAEILVKMLSMRPDKLQTIKLDNFRHLAKDFNVTLSEEFLYDK